jgi:hypothetical protein
MRISFRGSVLLTSTWISTGAFALAQQVPVAPTHVSTDVAVSFATEQSSFVPGQSSFWFKGGGADAAVNVWPRFGIAASLTGDAAADTPSGLDIAKITLLAGPQYSLTSYAGGHKHRVQLYGQGLFGGTHTFDGAYPTSAGIGSSVNSLAMEAGGGLNVFLTRSFGLRVFEVDYVRSRLANGTSNVQNDLRLAFGVTYRFGT